MTIFDAYKKHLKEKNTQLISAEYPKFSILNEGFVSNYYLIIFQVYPKYYILIDNAKKGNGIFEIPTESNPRGYVICRKEILKAIIPESLFKKLCHRGLYKNRDSGLSTFNNYWAIHRLVSCISYNILGKEVHHKSKNPRINEIDLLIPVKRDDHDKADDDLVFASELYEKFDKRSKNRYTLAKNGEMVKEVLDLAYIHKFKAKDIYKKVKKISKSKIYELIDLFSDYLNVREKLFQTSDKRFRDYLE